MVALHCCYCQPAGVQDVRTLEFGKAGAQGEIPAPWTLKVNEGKPFVNVVSDDGREGLLMKSDDASFSLERNLSLSIRDYPYLTWQWKALDLPMKGDARIKERDDQALQLLVAFDNRKILSYVWDSNAPEGTVVDDSVGVSFLSLAIKVVVVKSGAADAGKWITMKRDILDDYTRLFHEEPEQVKGIRVQINSQHTADKAAGIFGDIEFSKTPKAP